MLQIMMKNSQSDKTRIFFCLYPVFSRIFPEFVRICLFKRVSAIRENYGIRRNTGKDREKDRKTKEILVLL
jgi:hypothetical protein